MNDQTLGRLIPVELREFWSSEASDFTPWLVREENLSILGDVLGVDLELEAQEQAVEPFRADILCKEIGSGTWVLIENQLERSDHLHLGQLLTYASGLDAVTIVWIATTFTEEHRSTLDWLNRITDESFRFFGLEVELWRIGDSPAAPKFKFVSKPNNWSRSVAQAARAIDDSKLSPTAVMQRAYWEALHPVLNKVGGAISGNRKAQPKSWMASSIGRTGFHICAVMIRPKRQIRSELYLAGGSCFAGRLEVGQGLSDFTGAIRHHGGRAGLFTMTESERRHAEHRVLIQGGTREGREGRPQGGRGLLIAPLAGD